MNKTNHHDFQKKRIAVIGCGNLGSALVRGLITNLFSENPAQIIACDSVAEKVGILKQELGVRSTTDCAAASEGAHAIIIAVKPTEVSKALHVLKKALEDTVPKPLIISVAAGISVMALQHSLGEEFPLVRVMPNLPCLIGEGMSAIFAENCDDAETTQKIFQTLGETLRVDKEQELHVVTALSAGGPAFLFTVIEALADGGVKMGLARDKALKLAAQTMRGTGAMVLETGKHPGELKDMVASPGGTTIAGLHVLENACVRGAFIAAVEASTERARRLSEGSQSIREK